MLLLTAAVALYLLWRRKAVPAAAALPAPSIAAAPAGLSVPPMAAPDAATGIADVGAPDSASPSPARPGLIQTSVGLALTPLKLGASIAKGAVHTTEHVLGDIGSGIAGMFGNSPNSLSNQVENKARAELWASQFKRPKPPGGYLPPKAFGL